MRPESDVQGGLLNIRRNQFFQLGRAAHFAPFDGILVLVVFYDRHAQRIGPVVVGDHVKNGRGVVEVGGRDRQHFAQHYIGDGITRLLLDA